MNTARIYSRAKINISLDVLEKRPDNYHEVSMIMQTLKLADIIDIEKTTTGKIELSTNLSYLPTNENNIAYKAVNLFFDYTKIEFSGVKIHITKKIPVSAGLAGGSTNAAGVLLGLNKLYGTKLFLKEIMTISKELGADVPYCVHGGTMLAEGIGEKLSYVSTFPECKVVLCKPSFSVSTAKVYEKLSNITIENRPNNKELIDYIKRKDLNGICDRMYNVLEEVTSSDYPQIELIKSQLTEFGAIGVMMSGSGPTVFGLFDDEAKAIKAKNSLKRKFKETHITDISNSINRPY